MTWRRVLGDRGAATASEGGEGTLPRVRRFSGSLLEWLIMIGSAKSVPDTVSPPDLQAISAELATLKKDVARLMRQLRASVTDDGGASARDTVEHIGDEVVRAYHDWVAQGERSVKSLGRQVEEQPVTSLLLAFAAGFLGSRLLLR